MKTGGRRDVIVMLVVGVVVLGLLVFLAGIGTVTDCYSGPDEGDCRTSWHWQLP